MNRFLWATLKTLAAHPRSMVAFRRRYFCARAAEWRSKMKNGGSFRDYKIFCGNACRDLAEEMASFMGKPLGKSDVTKFSDGEISVNVYEIVRGRDIYIIQSVCEPVNDNLMELLIMIDAMRRASAGRVNAVIPYYGYARQDRKVKARDPITAKLVANLISVAGADRVLTMDLHAAQIQGYFDIPVDHLLGMSILVKYFKKKKLPDLVIVSPDHGSVTRARTMAEPLNVPIAIVDKRRPKPNVSEIMHVIGDIKGKNCILVDDLIDTAGTITNAANKLKELGAQDIYACATHGVLSGKAIENINDSAIKEMILLNTIPIPESKRGEKIKVLSVAETFAEAMTNIFTDNSISKMFDNKVK
jgi:ribose-phosphate pyrophosphokinase